MSEAKSGLAALLGAVAATACVHYTATSSAAPPPAQSGNVASAAPPPPSPPPPTSGLVVSAAPGGQPAVVEIQGPQGGAYSSAQVWVNGKLVSGSNTGNLATGSAMADVQGLLAGITDIARTQCAAGNQRGCVSLALDYWTGNCVPRDRAKARDMLKRACDAGEQSGCRIRSSLDEMATAMAPTTVVTAQPGATAVEFGAQGPAGLGADVVAAVRTNLETGCSGGNQPECVGLGMLYWTGRFVPKDPAKARQLLTGACHAGDQNGCHLLGVLGGTAP